MEDIKVRKLETKDLFTVADILGECGEDFLQIAGTLIRKALIGGEGGVSLMTYQMIGVTLFTSALKKASGKLRIFLADLTGMKVEEFDHTPLNTIPKIINILSKQEDLVDFFQKLSPLIEQFSGEKQTSSKNDTDGKTKKS